MKRLTRALLALYPRRWRDRYADELEGLMEDTGGALKHLPDVTKEALKMRIISMNWRLTAACALAGLVIATAMSFGIRESYTSFADLEVRPVQAGDSGAVEDHIHAMTGNILSRTSLSNIIQRPDLLLYPKERSTKPLEDVIETMKARDLTIATLPNGHVRVAYRGASPAEARSVVGHVLTRFMDENQRRQRSLAAFGEQAPKALQPHGMVLEVSHPPSTPSRRDSPNRPMLAGAGLLAGLAVALAFAVVRRAPRVWLFGGLSALAAAGLAYIIPLPYLAQASVDFDSAATLQRVVADRHRILADVERQLLRDGLASLPAQWPVALDFQAGASATFLRIRGRATDRFAAQIAVQKAITAIVNAIVPPGSVWNPNGPRLEVVDPPSLPLEPIGAAWRQGLLIAGLIVTLLAGLALLFDRRRNPASATPQPA